MEKLKKTNRAKKRVNHRFLWKYAELKCDCKIKLDSLGFEERKGGLNKIKCSHREFSETEAQPSAFSSNCHKIP